VKAQKFFGLTSNHFCAFTQVIHKFQFGFNQNTFCELHKSFMFKIAPALCLDWRNLLPPTKLANHSNKI